MIEALQQVSIQHRTFFFFSNNYIWYDVNPTFFSCLGLRTFWPGEISFPDCSSSSLVKLTPPWCSDNCENWYVLFEVKKINCLFVLRNKHTQLEPPRNKSIQEGTFCLSASLRSLWTHWPNSFFSYGAQTLWWLVWSLFLAGLCCPSVLGPQHYKPWDWEISGRMQMCHIN